MMALSGEWELCTTGGVAVDWRGSLVHSRGMLVQVGSSSLNWGQVVVGGACLCQLVLLLLRA